MTGFWLAESQMVLWGSLDRRSIHLLTGSQLGVDGSLDRKVDQRVAKDARAVEIEDAWCYRQPWAATARASRSTCLSKVGMRCLPCMLATSAAALAVSTPAAVT